MTEIYKTEYSLNPTFMRDVFSERNIQYNLRSENHLQLPVAKTTAYGLENIEYRVCLLWSTLPKEIKDSNNLNSHWKLNNRIEILASADYAKFLKKIYDYYSYPLLLIFQKL